MQSTYISRNMFLPMLLWTYDAEVYLCMVNMKTQHNVILRAHKFGSHSLLIG